MDEMRSHILRGGSEVLVTGFTIKGARFYLVKGVGGVGELGWLDPLCVSSPCQTTGGTMVSQFESVLGSSSPCPRSLFSPGREGHAWGWGWGGVGGIQKFLPQLA